LTRLLLDAHLSGRAIGRALRDRGHDIRSLDAEKNLEGLRDEDVLELAISEDRVLITANVADFLPLLTALIELGRSHPGCILIPNSFRNEDFGPLISAIDRELQEVPPDEWTDRSWLTKRSPKIHCQFIARVYDVYLLARK
jgi:predicted nuclease of predicted toxin-antitoxin system